MRTILAFDPKAIHAGNRGLAIDHDAVAARVDELLAAMTREEKVAEIHGLQAQPIDDLYVAGGCERLGIPTYRMVDGPRGARAGRATAFPVAIARAATFDVELERRVGLAVGLEVAAKGGNVVLAPTINLLRHPCWGRAQETYSEDPVHMGAMAVAFVSGAQNHVLASPKHFALNNVENTRFEMSANVDARTLHEVYLPHFRRCVVEAGAASIMTAYNKMNGVFCGENETLIEAILRQRWGFKGFVESDWFLGTRSTGAALRAGLDIEMPAPFRRSAEKLTAELESGEFSEGDIERAARNAVYQKIAWDLANLPVPDAAVVECEAHVALAREAAEKSLVLLKNEGDILPLAPEARIAVVGDLATMANLGDRGSSMVTSTSVVKPLDGIRARLGAEQIDHFASDADLSGLGSYDAVVVITGLTYREEGEFIPTEQLEAPDGLARGGDRADMKLPEAELALLARVAEHAKNTVVVLEGGSAVDVSDWIDNVHGLVMAWYPGREGGHAIASLLFGDICPSGRLPVSFPRSMRQLMDWDITALDVRHDLLHGYRWLEAHDESPRFPFGFGLSYTQFQLGNLELVSGGKDSLALSVEVSNTGERRGATVVQLYVSAERSAVTRVPKELKHFARAELEPGETARVRFELDAELLAYFDEASDDFVVEACDYLFQAGFDAGNLPLSTRLRFDGDSFEPVP